MAVKGKGEGKGAGGRKRAEKRQYSDSDKATALAALDANGGNVSGTARQLSIPAKTIENWAKSRGVHPAVAKMGEVKKRELADKLEELAHQIIDAAPDKIEKAGLKDSMIAAGTAIDKMQLLRGKPTAIVMDTAKSTVADIVAQTGLSEARARQIVAEQFGVAERELVSEAVN